MTDAYGHDILKLTLVGDDNYAGASASRAMKITFELTAGGKVINGRIYTPKGLQASVDSWTRPYSKPIQVHHDAEKDAIGRFCSVRTEDQQEQALASLGGDYRALAEVVAAYDTNDPQKIYKVMDKYRLLDNRDWPGLMTVVAEAKITDPDAVAKFQDERYLTLSAGHDFHQVVCGKCGQDWKADGACDHPPLIFAPGDKDATVLIIPGLDGKEASVVNQPANNTSYVHEKVMMGSDAQVQEIFSAPVEDGSSLLIGRDAKFELEPDYEQFGWDQLKLLSPRVVASLISTRALQIQGADQFTGVPDKGFLQSVCALLGQDDPAVETLRSLTVDEQETEIMTKEELDQLVTRLQDLENKVQALGGDSQEPQVQPAAEVPGPELCACGKPKGSECTCKTQLEADYTQALQTIEQLKAEIQELRKEPEAQAVASQDEVLETTGVSAVAAGEDVLKKVAGDQPPPGPSAKELDSYARFVMDRAQKMKSLRGTDAAKAYVLGQRQYLASGVDLDELFKLIGD